MGEEELRINDALKAIEEERKPLDAELKVLEKEAMTVILKKIGHTIKNDRWGRRDRFGKNGDSYIQLSKEDYPAVVKKKYDMTMSIRSFIVTLRSILELISGWITDTLLISVSPKLCWSRQYSHKLYTGAGHSCFDLMQTLQSQS